MDRDICKYNDSIARYIAMLIIQNRYNTNRGMSYAQAVKKYTHIKRSIDFWLEKADPAEGRKV